MQRERGGWILPRRRRRRLDPPRRRSRPRGCGRGRGGTRSAGGRSWIRLCSSQGRHTRSQGGGAQAPEAATPAPVVVHAEGPLPQRRRLSRLVAVASATSTPPAGVDITSHGRGSRYGIVDGSNGAVAPTDKSIVLETTVERVIFDFRLLALLAVAGSVLCFLDGCIFIKEAYQVYWSSCVKGVHSGQMVLSSKDQ